MNSNQGHRMVMRINTPTNPEFHIEAENKLIAPNDSSFPNYVFVATGTTTWERRVC